MRRFLTPTFAVVLVASIGGGCASTKSYFTVTSYPEGAVIHVDGEPRGQTTFQRLEVDFEGREFVTLRLEKDGYQAGGAVLTHSSPRLLVFFLQESPANRGILDELGELRRGLDRLANRVETLRVTKTHGDEAIREYHDHSAESSDE